MTAHTQEFFPYLLPRGLPEHAEVTVEEMSDGQCQVRDQAGRCWRVDVVNIDTGRLVWEEGHWVQPPVPAGWEQ